MQGLLGWKAFSPTAKEQNAVQLPQKPGEDFQGEDFKSQFAC